MKYLLPKVPQLVIRPDGRRAYTRAYWYKELV